MRPYFLLVEILEWRKICFVWKIEFLYLCRCQPMNWIFESEIMQLLFNEIRGRNYFIYHKNPNKASMEGTWFFILLTCITKIFTFNWNGTLKNIRLWIWLCLKWKQRSFDCIGKFSINVELLKWNTDFCESQKCTQSIFECGEILK